MRWTVTGANAIIALRCWLLSGRFEDFWGAKIMDWRYYVGERQGMNPYRNDLDVGP